MSDISDDFGPWVDEQPSAGFCVCCYKEKIQHEIQCVLDKDDIDGIKDDDSESTKLEERNIKKLPLVICHSCMAYDEDDDFFDIPLDELWKDDNNE